MQAGVSTACLYPRLLEESVYDLAVSGIAHTEIFVNTVSECTRTFVSGMADTMKRFDMTCRALHPFTCPIEPMLFFSEYERRVADALEFHKMYFQAMNWLGAEIFVFHGNQAGSSIPQELYFERFYRLAKLGKEFGVTVAQENVSRCTSGSLRFLKEMKRALGDDAHFVLDTKQAIRSKENIFDVVRALGSSIVHVHISDHGDRGDCLQIGKGRFDIRRFLRLLRQEGADCSIMLELYRSNFSNLTDLVSNYNTLVHMIGSLEPAGR